ncbi:MULTISPECIES: hypothetical protein [Sphingomonas]|jgi:hypothetical protein|uniref:hypothetical protein n=1 Tax=Sphingomonas TaxID=13687 RepID=UPI000830F822|nr:MULTISPECIES: hypothetical protein [Sphingomonas]MBY0300561.1 hypothetical protein [Sphingomonas ginsenosidimutans]
MRRTTITPRLPGIAAILAAALALAGCGSPKPAAGPDVNAVDAALLGNDADPALTAALRDQIMVDPMLVQQANDDAVRPPTMPASGAVPPDGIAQAAMPKDPLAGQTLRSAPAPSADCPQCAVARRALTLGALAGGQGGATAQCAGRVAYSAVWATRLPGSIPLIADARVIEAAGADGDGCRLRIVTFASAQPMQRLLDYYYTRATAAGFRAGHQADGAEHVLAGTKAGGGAFLALLRPHAGGGTEVDLMVDGG